MNYQYEIEETIKVSRELDIFIGKHHGFFDMDDILVLSGVILRLGQIDDMFKRELKKELKMDKLLKGVSKWLSNLL